MEDLKQKLQEIMDIYSDVLIYTEVLLGYCDLNFEEKCMTPALKCLEDINKLNLKNYDKLDDVLIYLDK